MKNKSLFVLLICVLLSLLLFSACSSSDDSFVISSPEQLNSEEYTIGLPEGAAAMYAGEAYFDDAQVVYYSSISDAYIALQGKKIDGFVFDSHALEYAQNSNSALKILPDSKIADEFITIGAPFENEELIAKVNEFIAIYRADGTYDEMYERWFGSTNPQMPNIESPQNPEMKIIVGTEGMTQPMNYFGEGGELTGFDAEFIKRLALHLNAEIEVKTMNFPSLIAGMETGALDLLVANLNATDAVREVMLVSDTYVDSEICLLVNVDHVGEKAGITSNEYRIPLYADSTELTGKRMGVVTGTTFDTHTKNHISDAEILYFNTFTDLVTALKEDKIDAFLMDEPIARTMVEEDSDIVFLQDKLVDEQYSYAMTKGDENAELKSQLDEYLQEFVSTGGLAALDEKWFGDNESLKQPLDMGALSDENGLVSFALVPTLEPFCYIKGGEVLGYDVEIMYNFCMEYGYRLEIAQIDPSSALEGLLAGKYDIWGGGVSVTEERQESVDFLTPTYSGGVVLVTKNTGTKAIPEFDSYEDLRGETVAALSGAAFFDFVDDGIGAGSYEQYYYNDLPSGVEAVSSGKAAAMMVDEPVARLLAAQRPELATMGEPLVNDIYGIAVKKDSELTPLIDAVIEQFYQDGTMDALGEKWFSADESVKTLPELDFSDASGTLRYAHDSVTVPMSYVGDGGNSLGYDIELVLRIGHALGMNVEFTPMNFDALIPALESGKVDIVSGCMSITEERQKVVDFTIPYYTGGIMGVTRSLTPVVTQDENFFTAIADSFTATFITEARWKLILEGIGVTLLISVLSVIFGSILGFAICLAKMSKNKVLCGVASIYVRLFQGTPIVVILMIFNYIIFASYNGNPVWIAVLSFGMNFAAYVSEMMRVGILAVDKGQTEAALAIGFSKTRTFFKIVFPQAARHFLPVFRGEFISLVKMTSVVGYIAIQDLTKMSDIIRSRTYEAFFPLIATAIIYFVLAYLLTASITVIEKKINPLSRKRTLKGVDTK